MNEARIIPVLLFDPDGNSEWMDSGDMFEWLNPLPIGSYDDYSPPARGLRNLTLRPGSELCPVARSFLSDGRGSSMSSHEVKRRAILLLVEGEEDVDGERLRFFQSIVVYAQDAQDAERQVSARLARQGASLISIDPEETREVEPESVKLGGAIPEEGIIGMTGRIWVKPGLIRRLGSKIRKIWH